MNSDDLQQEKVWVNIIFMRRASFSLSLPPKRENPQPRYGFKRFNVSEVISRSWYGTDIPVKILCIDNFFIDHVKKVHFVIPEHSLCHKGRLE
jgi:hypothetical protein